MKTTNKSTIGKFWDWIKGLFGIKAEEVATAVSNAKDEVKETKRNVETKVEDVFADLKETYAEAKEVTEEVVEEVKEVFEEAKDAVEEVIEDAVEKVTGSDKEVVETVETVETVEEAPEYKTGRYDEKEVKAIEKAIGDKDLADVNFDKLAAKLNRKVSSVKTKAKALRK